MQLNSELVSLRLHRPFPAGDADVDEKPELLPRGARDSYSYSARARRSTAPEFDVKLEELESESDSELEDGPLTADGKRRLARRSVVQGKKVSVECQVLLSEYKLSYRVMLNAD